MHCTGHTLHYNLLHENDKTIIRKQAKQVSIARPLLLNKCRCLTLKCTTISGNCCFLLNVSSLEKRMLRVGSDVCFFVAFFSPQKSLFTKAVNVLPTVLSAVWYTVISRLFSCSARFPNQAPTLRCGCSLCTASIWKHGLRCNLIHRLSICFSFPSTEGCVGHPSTVSI